ncbi:hypothetical protein [uncultured Megasphaera sp.]|uniref:hypothetical protein n=1 Tax=uncultured Megasphaera sp. TaxID=165188 RepID=UPI00266BF37A|nr:hypothetical protein [uncultured Megasphaera sp.]
MEIPMTITVYLKINGLLYSDSIYSEAKRSFVLKDGAAPLLDIRAIAENMKNEIKELTGAETVEFITQEEYEENGD